MQQDMQQRLEEALAENKAQAESLREACERNMHFSARVVALNSRVAQLTKQVCQALHCNIDLYVAAALDCFCHLPGQHMLLGCPSVGGIMLAGPSRTQWACQADIGHTVGVLCVGQSALQLETFCSVCTSIDL